MRELQDLAPCNCLRLTDITRTTSIFANFRTSAYTLGLETSATYQKLQSKTQTHLGENASITRAGATDTTALCFPGVNPSNSYSPLAFVFAVFCSPLTDVKLIVAPEMRPPSSSLTTPRRALCDVGASPDVTKIELTMKITKMVRRIRFIVCAFDPLRFASK